MNISEQQLDPNFLRKHPRSYTEEPIAEDKMGGRNQMREKIAELIRENKQLRDELIDALANVGFSKIALKKHKAKMIEYAELLPIWARLKFIELNEDCSDDRETD